MKLGIMQPYFFPNIGHFSLISATDKWIVFDSVQFIRHGWIERNRILKPSEDWQYIGVPLEKHSRDILIKDIVVNNNEDWKTKILRQLEHYKKRAPYYSDVLFFLNESFNFNTSSIVSLNAHFLKCTCDYVGLDFDYKIFSESQIEIDPINCAGDWALNISKALGAEHYINPIGGRDLFDLNKFKENGIAINFLQPKPLEYSQRRPVFESNLSIIDAMMFNSKIQIREMINQYDIV
jgi:hypothetical protein